MCGGEGWRRNFSRQERTPENKIDRSPWIPEEGNCAEENGAGRDEVGADGGWGGGG